MITAPLFTKRLRLEPVTAAMIDAAGMGRAQLARFVGAHLHEMWSGSHVFDRGRGVIVDRVPQYALAVHRGDNIVIGDVRFTPRRAGPGIEIGYEIVPPYRRQGYATEGAGAVIAALERAGAPAIIAGCSMRNVASVRTLRRLGFTLDGSTARGNAFWWVWRPTD